MRSAIRLIAPLLLTLPAPPAASAVNRSVRLITRDSFGNAIPVRIHVRDAENRNYPRGPDPVLLSHDAGGWMHGYFYSAGDCYMSIPEGHTTVTISRGFEWRPALLAIDVSADTTITVTMGKPFDIRTQAWYSGDVHVHTRHPTLDYLVSPEQIALVGRAEDLALVWCLDQDFAFTGAPDSVSTPESAIYYSTEYRNQTYGHVSLLGLRAPLGYQCCESPAPAAPLLSDLRASWAPADDQAMVLCHPWNGGAFSGEGGWPDLGLGRELPVMAALGALDAVDICSYSNAGDVQLSDWYALLACGLRIAPSAGTDAVTNQYPVRPPGGYRVFVREFPPSPHDPSKWVRGLRAGRCFVSNLPLIPIFSVEGASSGSVLGMAGPEAELQVHFRILCPIALTWATIIVNGEAVESFELTPGADGSTVADITTTLTLNRSSWIALRVAGYSILPAASNANLFAHTGPVYVELDGEPMRSEAQSLRFLAWIDSLEALAQTRGNWPDEETQGQVLSRFEQARAFYRQALTEAREPAARRRAAPPALRLVAAPHPSAGAVRLIASPPAGECTIEIFDLLGRCVATSRRDAGGRGSVLVIGDGRFVWDGRVDGGRDAPSGVYWAVAHARDGMRPRGGDRAATARIVIAR